MRYLRRFATLATLIVLALALTACVSTSGSNASTPAITPDERPVPDGMPVMYEFYTLT